MNTKTFVSKINKLYKQENGYTMADNGYRVRVTKECGDNVIELGHTYFYTSQAHVESTAETVRAYAKGLGLQISLDPIGDKKFNTRTWPKDSWATQLYRIDIE
jgi:hypothetical protein